MSVKKSAKLDLLVRVRYANPIPPPPCPPKLLDIPTNTMRYAKPEFMNAIASEFPLPMVVDVESGMPLDLSQFESLWEVGEDDSALNPDPKDLPKLDPKDAFLLEDPSSSTGTNYANGAPAGPSQTTRDVTWLRETEYISRESSQRAPASEAPKPIITEHVDVSKGAQLTSIEASFKANNDDFSLENLRHPNNPKLRAVESYPIMPDDELWANHYDLFRFSERPGERPLDVPDERLDCAIFRPWRSKKEDMTYLAYYLAKDDDSALEYKEKRAQLHPYEAPEDQEESVFEFVRDYETVKIEQEVPNEFLLVLQDEEEIRSLNDVMDSSEVQRPPREKGAYYKTIARKIALKKKRATQYDDDEDTEEKSQLIRARYAAPYRDQEEEIRDSLAELTDPMYLLNRDAEGEIEVDDPTAAAFGGDN